MNQEFIILFKEFIKIKNLGWIKSMRKGYSGIGYTFETLLGKKEDSMPFPDYNGIEIKVMRRYSKQILHLFSIVPDGDYLFPIQRVLDKLGYPDKKNKKYKILNMNFNCIDFTEIGYYRRAKLTVDDKNKKIRLIAFDYLGNNLNVDISWSFELLKERLLLKLKRLVLIRADVKIINNEEYYNYKNIYYYKLKKWDNFIDLIKKGKIDIGFKIDYIKSGEREGQISRHGVYFSINLKDIDKLFDKIPLELFEYQLI